MYFVYILESEQTGRFYFGSGENIQERLLRYNRGSVASTKRFRPYKIAFKETLDDKSLARKIELRLKKLKRKDYLEKIIKSGKIKIAETMSSYAGRSDVPYLFDGKSECSLTSSWAISSSGRASDS